MCQLETGTYTVFWNDIFERANATSKILQDPQLDLNSAVKAVKSLKTFVESKRNCFQECEKEGIKKSGTAEYIQKRQRRRDVWLDPLDQPRQIVPQVELTQSDRFRIANFLPAIDCIGTKAWCIRAYFVTVRLSTHAGSALFPRTTGSSIESR